MDAREAVKALIVANHFLETELEKLRAAVSPGYARGKLLPRDRKDWYDYPLGAEQEQRCRMRRRRTGRGTLTGCPRVSWERSTYGSFLFFRALLLV
jgi:hypothetical protein